MLLFAYEETVHNKQFVDGNNIFKLDNYHSLSDVIGEISSNKTIFSNKLSMQLQFANSSSIESFQKENRVINLGLICKSTTKSLFFNYLLKFYLIIVIFKNNIISFVILISSNEMRCINEVFELATQMFNHYIPNYKQFIISIFIDYLR